MSELNFILNFYFKPSSILGDSFPLLRATDLQYLGKRICLFRTNLFDKKTYKNNTFFSMKYKKCA